MAPLTYVAGPAEVTIPPNLDGECPSSANLSDAIDIVFVTGSTGRDAVLEEIHRLSPVDIACELDALSTHTLSAPVTVTKARAPEQNDEYFANLIHRMVPMHTSQLAGPGMLYMTTGR